MVVISNKIPSSLPPYLWKSMSPTYPFYLIKFIMLKESGKCIELLQPTPHYKIQNSSRHLVSSNYLTLRIKGLDIET